MALISTHTAAGVIIFEAALKSSPVHRPECILYLSLVSLSSAEIFFEFGKYHRLRLMYSKHAKQVFAIRTPFFSYIRLRINCLVETPNYSIVSLAFLPIHQGLVTGKN